MTRLMRGRLTWAVVATLAVILTIGVVFAVRMSGTSNRIHVTAYFANSNGVFVGDEVRVLGMPVGTIDAIEPQPGGAKIGFWVDQKFKVPAEANAAIIAPSLVSVRAVQLTPAYTTGPVMTNGAVIPKERTVVPVEWDDLRVQLQRLSDTLQPTQPGGVSTLGEAINTAADNLRGQGNSIRDTLTKMSQAFDALGDHSSDWFSTIKNVSTLVSALQGSQELMRDLNRNLAAVSGLIDSGSDQVGSAVSDINDSLGDVRDFIADNKEPVGITTDKLASLSTALNQSLGDIKQTLHIAPNTFQNFLNIYQPAQDTLSGVLAANNFSNPINFLCGAIQAASRLNAEQSAKLCVQYLAPIVKNRQYNFPPLGENLIVGAPARPNELTYSEDWLRPDYVPPASDANRPTTPPTDQASAPVPPVLPAEAPTNPNAGLAGMMVPPGAGS
jgi:phospholipid/cholesterol/gamma-HCH transport system substrate-binding protein